MLKPKLKADPAADVRERIANARGFIFDMDGTIALGDSASGGHQALPGAIDLLAALRRKGVPFRVYTNGSAKAPSDYAKSLRSAGFDLSDEEMMTPSTSAAAWLVEKGIGRVRVLGNAGTAAPLKDAGIEIIEPHAAAEGVEAVFTGWFREFTFPDLEAACHSVWGGAKLISASHVPFFATKAGRGIGSSFAINVMIQSLTGKRAKVLGKPSREGFLTALAGMGLPGTAAHEVVVVGDDPALETRMANDSGAISVGVATGLRSLGDWEELGPKEKPLLAISGVAELLEVVG